MLTLKRFTIKYSPHIIFGCIVLLLVFMVNIKGNNRYANRKFKYSANFPNGWIRDYAKPLATAYSSESRMPISDLPEATITVVVDERYGELDLAGHFQILLRDLRSTGVYIANSGEAYVGFEPSTWVEFTDPNGLERHVWYVLFNRTNKLLIIQYRVTIDNVEKYNTTFQAFLESFKI